MLNHMSKFFPYILCVLAVLMFRECISFFHAFTFARSAQLDLDLTLWILQIGRVPILTFEFRVLEVRQKIFKTRGVI